MSVGEANIGSSRGSRVVHAGDACSKQKVVFSKLTNNRGHNELASFNRLIIQYSLKRLIMYNKASTLVTDQLDSVLVTHYLSFSSDFRRSL